ncbi:MAG TPA: winged helix-turn-helix domain-containing protein [Terriglobales bacterium]|jgi:DNA-binding winged helix-turn-helix (wHTH) protein|nr:winged helix-turn-helix domain-containing protein [Terriglobales bacterium]
MALASKANLAVVARSLVTRAAAVQPSHIRLGEHEFDCRAGELRSGRGKVILQTQPHKILLMLLEQPGEIVTREEIQQRLWPDGIIVNFEVSINQAISKLRHALNDAAANPRFIETVGRRGYRLLVPVDPAEEMTAAYGRRKDDRVLHVPANTSGAMPATETKAMADALIKLLPLLVCLNHTSADEPQSGVTLVRRVMQAT